MSDLISITNNLALLAYRGMSNVQFQSTLNRSVSRLSSGVKSTIDGPTELALSERFRSRINGFEYANKNMMSAYNMLQVADGALNESHSILQRIRQLALQAIDVHLKVIQIFM